jgi:hypothetical protein|tara:strand:- start:90 stop:872 length:783 start_codon:yes stop_codon:yes gene_type:complete
MRKFITTILILLSISAYSQKSLILENIDLNQNMRLIGMYPHYDKEKTFEKYNFLIVDFKVLDSLSKLLTKGKEVKNQFTKGEFNIRLYQGNKKLKTWSFNPKYSYLRINGKSYEFDANQILSLAKSYPLEYSFNKMSFKSEEEFNKKYENLKLNENLLFVYKPNFKFGGKFEVKFLKTKKFKHPKAITAYLNKYINKSRKKDEYRAYYVLTNYNKKNRNQYTMTIESDLDLFESFNIKKGEKGKWIQNEFTATIFMKENN